MAPTVATGRPRSRHLGLAAFALILLVATVAMPVWALASTVRAETDITIASGETVTDDLFATSNTFTLAGTASRDVFVAARQATIDGSIEGSLNIAAAELTLDGTVAHSVRIAGGDVAISGRVNGDLLVFGANVNLAESARVAGDLQVFGGDVAVAGTVGGSITGSVGTLAVNGEVGGDVDVTVDRIDVADTATVAGDLRYTSARDGEIAGGAEITGAVERQSVAPWGTGNGTQARLSSPLVRTLWLLVTGAVLIALAPRMATALNEILARPLAPVIAGVIALVGIPIVAVLLLATVIGIPLSLLMVGLWLAALYLSQVIVGQRLGAWLLPRSWADGSRGHLLLSMTIGVLIISTLRFVPVPYLGTVVNALVAIAGLGAAVLLLGRLRPRYVVSRA